MSSGTTESYEVIEPAVDCMFENNAGQTDDELNTLEIKKIRNVHGLASPPSNLEGRRSGRLPATRRPHNDGIFQKYDVLPWVYKQANNNTNPKKFGPWTLQRTEQHDRPMARAGPDQLLQRQAGTTVVGQCPWADAGGLPATSTPDAIAGVHDRVGPTATGATSAIAAREFH